MDWKQRFIDLYNDVAACEAPEGTQVDDVLLLHHDLYAKATYVTPPRKEIQMTTLEEINAEITASKGAPFENRAVLGKEIAVRLFLHEPPPDKSHPDFPALRATVKRVYMDCFDVDPDEAEKIITARGF